jgi:hypothetical protein
MALVKKKVLLTIPAGQALSDSGDLMNGNLVTLLVPLEWTPANISFLVSDDNQTFYDLHDSTGKEELRAFVAGSAVLVDSTLTQGSMFIKIRSGPRYNPVIQRDVRVIKCIII